MPKSLPVAFDPIRKQLFVENLALRLNPVDAARAAGFVTNLKAVASALLEDDEVKERIEGIKAEIARKYDVSRERVLEDLVDAKEIARVQGNAHHMVMALNPIIDVMGYRAPKQLDVTTRREGDSNIKKRLRVITDQELIELAEEQGFEAVDLLPTTLDGTSEEVKSE